MKTLPPKVLKEARKIYNQKVASKEFPEDDWFSISEDWDLNLFIDDNGNKCATAYPVKDGMITTMTGYSINQTMHNCPFCLNHNLEFEEVETPDAVRVSVTCLDCGLRAPGAEDDDEEMAIDFWNELSENLLDIWNIGVVKDE